MKFGVPLSVGMEFVQAWEIRGSVAQQEGVRMSKRAKFGDPPPPGRQTWGFHAHPGGRGRPSVGNFGPPCLSRWNSCKCGRFGVP